MESVQESKILKKSRHLILLMMASLLRT